MIKLKIFKLTHPLWIIKIIIYLFFIGGIFYLFFISKLFIIKTIFCQKEEIPCSEQELSFFNSLQGQNIFLAKTELKINYLKSFAPTIGAVKIQKKLPQTILIDLIQREGLVLITNDKKKWYPVDKTGYLFQEMLTPALDLPKITTNEELFLGKLIDQNFLQGLATIVKDGVYNFKIKEISFDKSCCFILKLENNTTATVSAFKQVDDQLDSLQFILRQSKIKGKLPTFIDLRFDKPVVKF